MLSQLFPPSFLDAKYLFHAQRVPRKKGEYQNRHKFIFGVDDLINEDGKILSPIEYIKLSIEKVFPSVFCY